MPGGIPKSCSDEEFITKFRTIGATALAARLGITERSVYKRRANLERLAGAFVPAPTTIIKDYPHRKTIALQNGVVIVGSDFHIWPGAESTSLRAFKHLCRELKPSAVILNGDVLDFPQISRHPPIGWESTPSPVQEIEAAQDHLNDIVKAVPHGCRKLWLLGNHDARFETRLATVASEYKNLKGIHLSDHFPLFEKGWSAWINQDVVCKHRWKGGIHATHNNTLGAGKTMVTGHLHSQKVTPYTDYNGTRYGIDTGCVAETDHRAFVDYTEDNPKSWISGFAVLKFNDGRLMYPELVSKWDDNHVQFRGQLIRV
jgi:calcineurin-like phosphoesterase family protein